jgi:P27 family predicted phage terminase small subunit
MAQRGRKSAAKILQFAPRHDVEDIATAPAHFCLEDRKLWDRLASEYDIRDNAASAILEIAVASHARARACRIQITKDGLMIEGPNGAKAHPLIPQERQAHQQMLSALRRLGATIDEG